MSVILEKEQEILKELCIRKIDSNTNFDDIEVQLRRYNNALLQNNERNRRDTINKLIGLFEISKSSKRGRSFGEKLDNISFPPQIRELFNETIHNLKSRTTVETEKNALEPDNKIDENTESDQNS